ncbi:MAG: GNAT family N-acetyltransferase [Crenarchaeota archaeon]|nr:GNAT family N-acetyltransferase [Thermoproteota archaeon]
MMLVTGTRRPPSIDALCGIYSKATATDIPWISETMSSEEMIKWWFDASWFEPDKFVTVYTMNRPAGFAFIWWKHGRIRINPYIDPELPIEIAVRALETMFSWTRYLAKTSNSYVVQVYAGPEHGYLHRLTTKIMGVGRYIISSYIMVAPEHIPIDKECRAQIQEYRKGMEKAIAEIYNDAFSIYSWFIPMKPGDVEKIYGSKRIKALIAYIDDEPVGYVDFMSRGTGIRAGYIYTLAVKRKYQGHGVGRALLSRAIELLRKSGYSIVYLDAYSDVVGYYMGLGFRIIRRYVNLEYSINMLPASQAYMVIKQDA